MPIFEYRCPACDHEFELLIRGNDRPACPTCDSEKVDKLLSAASARVSGNMLPLASQCPPSDAPPCGPGCCRL